MGQNRRGQDTRTGQGRRGHAKIKSEAPHRAADDLEHGVFRYEGHGWCKGSDVLHRANGGQHWQPQKWKATGILPFSPQNEVIQRENSIHCASTEEPVL